MPPSRKSRRPTRRELQQLKEYGELDPLNSMTGENDLDALIGNAISRSGYGRLSRSVQERTRLNKGYDDSDAKLLSSFTKSQKVHRASAYSKLLSSFSTKQGAAIRKDNAIGSDDEEPSDAESMEDSYVEELEQQEAESSSSNDNMSDANTREGDDDDAEYEVDEVDNNELEDEGDAADAAEDDKGDKEEEDDIAEVYELGDFMAAHLADDES
ncbi:hypothetical protein LPJ81_006650, partial [Coemansia sp. IMI 209127]